MREDSKQRIWRVQNETEGETEPIILFAVIFDGTDSLVFNKKSPKTIHLPFNLPKFNVNLAFH